MKAIQLFIFSFLFTLTFGQIDDTSKVIVVDMETMEFYDQKTFELYYKPSWFNEDSVVKASVYMQKIDIPSLSDVDVISSMELIPTTFPLTFNNVVKQHIDQFSTNRRLLVSRSLGIGEYYFPIFEEVLSKYGLPDVLKYLPVIESNLNPFAKSHAGALGIWQFMPRTGKSLGLEQNDFYDERRDVHQATEAAAQYLKTLYSIYDDWLLALAAYNAGPGNVNKAIGQSGGKTTFWEIRPYLPRETREYVPKFTACVFVMYFSEFYKILPQKPSEDLFVSDTILIKDKLTIRYISELTGIDSAYLQFINPALKTGIIPKRLEGYPLNIPINFAGQFAALKDFMHSDPYLAEIKAEVADVQVPEYKVYKVKSGDTLGHIAMKHGVGVSQIKKWNSLKSDNLKIGQKIVLYI
jgi:membrane-bound lytic murein transglycosylase D